LFCACLCLGVIEVNGYVEAKGWIEVLMRSNFKEQTSHSLCEKKDTKE
jgi:hypothetical protein